MHETVRRLRIMSYDTSWLIAYTVTNTSYSKTTDRDTSLTRPTFAFLQL